MAGSVEFITTGAKKGKMSLYYSFWNQAESFYKTNTAGNYDYTNFVFDSTTKFYLGADIGGVSNLGEYTFQNFKVVYSAITEAYLLPYPDDSRSSLTL